MIQQQLLSPPPKPPQEPLFPPQQKRIISKMMIHVQSLHPQSEPEKNLPILLLLYKRILFVRTCLQFIICFFLFLCYSKKHKTIKSVIQSNKKKEVLLWNVITALLTIVLVDVPLIILLYCFSF